MKIYNSPTDSYTFAGNYTSFVTDLLALFDSSNVRVALMFYSTTARAEVNYTSNYGDVISAIDSTTPQYDKQFTNLGIDLAKEISLELRRPGVTQYIVVFGDGASFNTNFTQEAVVAAGDENITIIAVSMRGEQPESYTMAGRSYRVFTMSTPAELASRADIATDIADIICATCKGYADVVYLLDTSDSTRRISSDFSTTFYAPGVKDFVKNVTLGIEMGPIRESVILYSINAMIIANMTGNASAIVSAIDNMNPEYGSTNADLAFIKAREAFDNSDPTRPDDTQRYVIYLVDGSVVDTVALAAQALITRQSGVEVFAIGFAPTALLIDLILASGSVSNTFRVNSDLELNVGVQPLIDFLCQTPPSLTTSSSAFNPFA